MCTTTFTIDSPKWFFKYNLPFMHCDSCALKVLYNPERTGKRLCMRWMLGERNTNGLLFLAKTLLCAAEKTPLLQRPAAPHGVWLAESSCGQPAAATQSKSDSCCWLPPSSSCVVVTVHNDGHNDMKEEKERLCAATGRHKSSGRNSSCTAALGRRSRSHALCRAGVFFIVLE